MVWPFSERKSSGFRRKILSIAVRPFYNNNVTDIKPNQGMVALVIDSTKAFGTQEPVKTETNGTQAVTLKVAVSN